MPNPAPTAEPTESPDPAVADDDALFRQTIRLLLATGNKLIAEISEDPTLAPAAKADPYERVARSLRRTIALARHVADNPAKRAPAAAENRAQSRRLVIRELEAAIATRATRAEQAETLRDELDERLGDPEFEHDLATRPIDDIVRDLKRDFGIDPTYGDRHPRRTPDDIRELNARAAAARPAIPTPAIPTPATPRPATPRPAIPAPSQAHPEAGPRPAPRLARYRAAADG